MKALIAADREAFYASEIALREADAYPPFGRLASLLISGPDKHAAEGYARRIAAAAPRAEAVRVLGPAEAPLALVRGRHRFRILVKSPRGFDLSAYLRQWLAETPKRRARSSSKSMSTRRASSKIMKIMSVAPHSGKVIRTSPPTHPRYNCRSRLRCDELGVISRRTPAYQKEAPCTPPLLARPASRSLLPASVPAAFRGWACAPQDRG